MKKYIYAKNSTELIFEDLSNNFLQLCTLLGAYIRAKELIGVTKMAGITTEEFSGYLKEHNYDFGGRMYWSWLNEAYRFIRENIGEQVVISKNQIKKIGHSGFGTIPKYPIPGARVVHFLYIILTSSDFKTLNEVYFYYLSQNWIYLDEDKENVARHYVGFQNTVLRTHPAMMRELYHDEFFSCLYAKLKKGEGQNDE